MRRHHPSISITRERDSDSSQHPWRVAINAGWVLAQGNDADDFCADLREAVTTAAGMNERLRP